VIIRLAGGLGNQIFQLGAGLLLAEKSKCKTIVIDISGLAKYEVERNNNLIRFFDLTKSSVEIIFKQSFFGKFRLPVILPFNFSNYPLVSDRNFQKVMQSTNKFLWLDGYFQTCLLQKNFNKEVELLRPLFSHKDLPQKQGCVIHVRGGDFIKLGWSDVASSEFYANSIRKMQKDYGVKVFYVVTDDRDYAKSILKNIKPLFLGGSIQEDFCLIGQFQFRILSSSTFALWSSVLGHNSEKSVVIAPDELTPGIKRSWLLPNEINFDKHG